MSTLERIQTRPGYKFVAAIIAVCGFFMVMSWTQPVVVINDNNMVIEVDGEPTYRPVMNWDLKEAKIVRR